MDGAGAGPTPAVGEPPRVGIFVGQELAADGVVAGDEAGAGRREGRRRREAQALEIGVVLDPGIEEADDDPG